MAKGILEFSLPEEQAEFEIAQDGGRWMSAVSELDNWLRGKLKHSELSDAEAVVFSAVRDHLYSILDEDDLKLS